MTSVDNSQRTESIAPAILRVIGRDRHLECTLDDRLPMSVVEEELRKYLARIDGRFEGGKVTLNLGNRMIDVDQLKSLQNILEDQHKLILAGLTCGPQTLEYLLSQTAAPMDSVSQGKAGESTGGIDSKRTPVLRVSDQEERSTSTQVQETLLVKGTCRSGTTIYNHGNVVVAGDVNPGAEIAASRDIMVFGKLAGLAHAGAGGADGAVIIAFQIEAPQLRIGHQIKMDLPVGGGIHPTTTPRMVLVRGGTIVVEPFLAKSVWMQEE